MRNPVVEALSEVLERRDHETRDIESHLVLGRNRDGTSRLRPQSGECEMRGKIESHREGQVVESTPRPAFQLRGSLGAPLSSRLGGITTWVERLAPDTFQQGQTLTVDVIGRGFGSSTAFDFLLPDSDTVHPGITVTARRLITAELVEMDVTITAGAQLVESAALAYGLQVVQ